jgi:hypothetical protein
MKRLISESLANSLPGLAAVAAGVAVGGFALLWSLFGAWLIVCSWRDSCALPTGFDIQEEN